MKTVILLALAAALSASPIAMAGGHHGDSHSTYSGTELHRSHYAYGVPRDSHGRIARSSKSKHEFEKSNPCPTTGRSSGACPGYVVDHVIPLKRGGEDAPSNMQWQTKAAAKEKDRWE